MPKTSQCDRIIQYIRDFGSITTYQAFIDIGCTRLASRINDLKNRGYKFTQNFIPVTNRYGEKTNVMRYSLRE